MGICDFLFFHTQVTEARNEENLLFLLALTAHAKISSKKCAKAFHFVPVKVVLTDQHALRRLAMLSCELRCLRQNSLDSKPLLLSCPTKSF